MAGVLSAYGMGLANLRVEKQQSVELPLGPGVTDRTDEIVAALRADADRSLEEQNVPAGHRHYEIHAGLRVADSDTVIAVPYAGIDEMSALFAAAYRSRFGADVGDSQLVVATVQLAATGVERVFTDPLIAAGEGAHAIGKNSVWMEDRWCDVPLYERERLGAGAVIDGPAIVSESNGTTVIDSGWRGSINDRGHLLLEKHDTAHGGDRSVMVSDRPDPIQLEVFNRLFMHIAEQMGTVLQKTALSVNIRERLDFSCALFDAQGRLVSNAPHMPVHLGSMGESVRSVIDNLGQELGPGDAVMLNSPYNGGTHLPDITVVTPWYADSDRPQFFLASRAHHADIGGITPGSMPSASHHIDEEGVLIDNFFLVRGGEFRLSETVALLEGAKYPTRNTAQNIADLKAQMAANQQGIRQLEKANRRYGLQTVQNYLRFVRENAATSVRRLLGTLTDGSFEYELDSGETIRVSIRVDRDQRIAHIDFAATSPQSASNFNAPQAVTRAAVLYVFRSLIDEQIPMNEGCLEPLHIRIPESSLLSPGYPAAVVAGNVETSQCVTDALYGALGVLAASQGTMNNLTFGNDRIQYYETICGGAGAGDGFHGADAVHTHMTNSRLTDPEVLERKFPVLLESFTVRSGSGGGGRWHGGCGVIRRLRFLEGVDASILSNHRRIAPFGAAGGLPGATGRNSVIRANGEELSLSGTATISLEPGDVLIIETPGGGGFGPPRD
jgi:5-oxoprolinase (ATP-hydrolysing)